MNDTTSELLTLEEIFWRDHYDWLDRQGYTLRSRYKPDWAPYWKHSGRSPYAFEDGQILLVRSLLYSPSRAPSISNQTGQVIDAVRKSDGELVALKKIRKSIHPHEVEIGRYLSSPPLSEDFRNHCCPVYATLYPPENQDLVMQGMQFMHLQHVAHRSVGLPPPTLSYT